MIVKLKNFYVLPIIMHYWEDKKFSMEISVAMNII